MINPTKDLGNKGEAAVAQFLESRGFKILARNYQTKLGEVDIIASKKDLLAFVEVKTRKVAYFPISQVVTLPKQKRIIKTAQHYILAHRYQDTTFRFDVATVIYDNEQFTIEYIENAFSQHRRE